MEIRTITTTTTTTVTTTMATVTATMSTAPDKSTASTTTTTATAPSVLYELYASMRRMSAHPYLATIPGSGVRDSKRLIVIVKRAARIPVISYFLSS